MIQIAVITGVAFVAAEGLKSLHEIRRVLRALTWGGAFCGVVASLQFWLTVDITPYLRLLPGLSLTSESSGILAREALNRVAGTAIHPIELGVVAGMLLPLAVYVAIYDSDRAPWKRWAPVGLIAVAIPTSVSRSAILAVTLAIATLVVLMPVRQRLVALCALPFALVAVFMSAPGVIGAFASLFRAGTADPSVATRVDDYPLVERLVAEAPWFGHGGGTYFAADVFDILDNQYLKTAIELGLVGLVALTLYFLVPLIAAFVARRRSRDPELRFLCAALAGAALAAAACSFTFDSLSFPMVPNVHALVIGLIGACWQLSSRTPASSTRHVQPGG
jgi:O-antigen ligase